MAKKLKFESFKYRCLIAAQEAEYHLGSASVSWHDFVNSLQFLYSGGNVEIVWVTPVAGRMTIQLDEPCFYLRGDSQKEAAHQHEMGLSSMEDPIKLKNERYFRDVVMRIAESAGYSRRDVDTPLTEHNERIQIERQFHDAWANSEVVENIDVRAANEVCTAPEMRFITQLFRESLINPIREPIR